MEKDDEFSGSGNHYDFGARIYDSRLGRWMSIDPAFKEYPSMSDYSAFANSHLSVTDPDGKRLYYHAGASDDVAGWNYSDRWRKAFTKNGIKDFKRVHASGGTAHDLAFTHSNRYFGHRGQHFVKNKDGKYEVKLKRVQNKMIDRAVKGIMDDLAKNPLDDGEQLNLAGYSYGSVLLAHVSLRLADEGITVDNLILVGSPISSKSPLYNELIENENIKNVIRKDFDNDKLSNPSSESEYLEGVKDSHGNDSYPHFDLARPDDKGTPDVDEGKETDKKIDSFAKELKTNGVK